MYLNQHGLSNARDIQMAISEKPRQGCVVEDINKFMGFLTLTPSHQLFLGPQLGLLSVILRLDTKQVDYTCAFLHVPITKDVQLFCFKTRCPSLEFSSISTSKTITFGTNIWFLHSKLYSPSTTKCLGMSYLCL